MSEGVRRRRLAVLVVAAPPFIWFLHLAASYWLVPVACDAGTNLPLHAATVLALLASAAVVAFGVRVGRTASPPEGGLSGSTEVTALTELDHRSAESLGRAAVAMGAYFALIIVVTGLVAALLVPCT